MLCIGGRDVGSVPWDPGSGSSRGEMGSISAIFDPHTQSLYARARTMIVPNHPFYQKHVQAGVRDTPGLNVFSDL